MEERLAEWHGKANLNLLDKIRIWHMYAMSKLGYLDQLLTQPHEAVQTRGEHILFRYMGGPHGRITTEILGNLEDTLGFPMAACFPGQANMAAKTRTRMAMGADGGKYSSLEMPW